MTTRKLRPRGVRWLTVCPARSLALSMSEVAERSSVAPRASLRLSILAAFQTLSHTVEIRG
jgi:hypothetical protein